MTYYYYNNALFNIRVYYFGEFEEVCNSFVNESTNGKYFNIRHGSVKQSGAANFRGRRDRKKGILGLTRRMSNFTDDETYNNTRIS